MKAGNGLLMEEEEKVKIKKGFDNYFHFILLLHSALQVRCQSLFIFTVALKLMQQLTVPLFNSIKIMSDVVTATYTCACCWNEAPNMILRCGAHRVQSCYYHVAK